VVLTASNTLAKNINVTPREYFPTKEGNRFKCLMSHSSLEVIDKVGAEVLDPSVNAQFIKETRILLSAARKLLLPGKDDLCRVHTARKQYTGALFKQLCIFLGIDDPRASNLLLMYDFFSI
jgi:hypothetical protein